MKPTLKEIGESLIRMAEQGHEVESIYSENIPDKIFQDHRTGEESILEGTGKSVIQIVIR